VSVEKYQHEGFVVFDDVLGPEEFQTLRGESVSLCRGERGSVGGLEAARANVSDDAAVRRVLCLHFPHKLSPLRRELLALPLIIEVLTQLIGPDVKAMQRCSS
jgi:hypothetical protein